MSKGFTTPKIYLLLLLLFILSILPKADGQEQYEIASVLPADATVLEYSTGNLDTDQQQEICVLYEFFGHQYLGVFDQNNNQYTPYFLQDLGKPNKSTDGKVNTPYTGYTYRRTYLYDFNFDGQAEIVLLFWPEDTNYKELSIWANNGGMFSPLIKLSANFDFRMYQTQDNDYKIEAVNILEQNHKKYCVVQKWLWDRNSQIWQSNETSETVTESQYLILSRKRYELSTSNLDTSRLCLPLLNYSEIPLTFDELKPLFPGDIKPVQIIVSSAFDEDIDPEILLIYAENTNEKVLLKGSILNWDFNRKNMDVNPIPYQSYGYPTDPEGYQYVPVAVLNQFNISFLAFISNILPDGRYLSLNIAENISATISILRNFSGNFNIHFFMYGKNNPMMRWEILTVFQEKGQSFFIRRYSGEVLNSDSIKNLPIVETQPLSLKNYRRQYYRLEDTYYLKNEMFTNILRTNHSVINLWKDPLPNPETPGTTEDYILYNLNILQAQKWLTSDIDNDGKIEGFILVKHNKGPAGYIGFDLAVIKPNKKGIREHYVLNDTPFFMPENENNSLSDIYQYDLDGDHINEILVCHNVLENDILSYTLDVYDVIMDKFYKIYTQKTLSSFYL